MAVSSHSPWIRYTCFAWHSTAANALLFPAGHGACRSLWQCLGEVFHTVID